MTDKIISRFSHHKGYHDTTTFYEVLDEAWGNLGARLLMYYAQAYKENPKALIGSFIKFDSIKYGALCAIQNARRQGFLEECRKEKDFSDWVSKQPLEDRWRGVMNNFLIILWGVNK